VGFYRAYVFFILFSLIRTYYFLGHRIKSGNKKIIAVVPALVKLHTPGNMG